MVAQVHKVDAVCLYGIILVSVYVYGPYGLCILGPSSAHVQLPYCPPF
jgi:hypothetical protein